MELTIALAISILSATITVANFVVNRKDKAIKDAKEINMELIKYQLGELKDDVKAILSKIDGYEKETKKQIEEAFKLHIKIYHKGEK